MLYLTGRLTNCLSLPPTEARDPTSRTAVPATDSLDFTPSGKAYNHEHGQGIRAVNTAITTHLKCGDKLIKTFPLVIRNLGGNTTLGV
jgi:hypothetical protein